ncbi:MAG: hypothetical protein HXS54_02545 [Theionarchaea archaeon]|nr:hypothetical protein [Theionarchaea archaeon]
MLKFIKNMQKCRIGIVSMFLMCREVIFSASLSSGFRGILKGFFSFLEIYTAYNPKLKIYDEVKDR